MSHEDGQSRNNTHSKVRHFLLRAAFSALGLWCASRFLSGLHFASAEVLLVAALLLGVVNAVVRPLIVVLTLPITVVTLGLFLWAINAGMLMLVSGLLDGFHIDGFGTALGAALIVSAVAAVAGLFTGNLNVRVLRHPK